MAGIGPGFTDYDALPEIIRGMVTRKEYAWMSDDQKCNLIEDCTTPDDVEEPLQ